jgi:hypothetical protein
VMESESDDELEETRDLEEVRFSIRNWKTEKWVAMKHLKYSLS